MERRRAQPGWTRCSILVGQRAGATERDVLERFVARYFGQVDPEDLEERQPADLYGAALSHWNFARKREPGQRARARVQSDDRGARLAVDAHDHRDRQRRHAVPRRFGDDGGQPARPHAASHHPSDRRRRRATPTGTLTGVAAGRRADARRESFIHVEVDRDRRDAARSTRSPPTSRACSTTSRLAVDDWKKMQDELVGDRRRDRDAPAADPAGRARRGQGVPRLARRRPLHVPRLPPPRSRRRSTGRTRCGSSRARASASCARSRGKDVAASFAALPPEIRAYARVPELLIITKSNVALDRAPARLSRLRRRSSASTTRARSAASTASSASSRRRRTAPSPADIPLLRRKTANVVARARPRPQAATPARRCSTFSTTIRATSCSRPARTSCCARRWASCTSASGSASACSSGAIRSSASSSCLIYAPRENYTTELREKWQAILMQAFNGTSSEFNVQPVGVGAGARA